MGPADGLGAVDDTGAGDAGGGHVQGHGGPDDVRRFHGGGVKGAVAEDDDAVGVVDDRVGAELDQFRDPEEGAFVHLVPEHDRSLGPDGQGDHQGQEVGGQVGPGRGLDLGQDIGREGVLDPVGLAAPHQRGIPLVFDGYAQFPEAAVDQVEVVGYGLLDPHFAARHGAHGQERRDLVVIGRDVHRPAAEAVHALDVQDVRPDAFDPRPEGVEESAQVLHVGFARGVDQGRRALAQDRGHDEVLGPGHRHVILPDPVAPETAVQLEFDGIVRYEAPAQRTQHVHVGIDLPHAQGASLDVREPDGPGAVQQAGQEEQGRPHALRQGHLAGIVVKAGVVDLKRTGGPVPVDPGPQGLEEGDDFLHVGDVRHVPDRHRLIGQQRGAENGQHRVLVAGRNDRSGQRLSPLDDQTGHEDPCEYDDLSVTAVHRSTGPQAHTNTNRARR